LLFSNQDCYEQSLAIFRELSDQANVARSLHQLGVLYQAQREYSRARDCYEQSLAIKQKLDNRAGVAISLHNLGRLFEEEGAHEQAVRYVAQAFAIATQLGLPERRLASSALARLQEKMGAERFAAALAEAGAAVAPPEEETQEAGPGMSREQAAARAVQNTVSVLTDAPEHKAGWWENLGRLEAQARGHGDADFAALLGLLRRVVEGSSPAALADQVPPEFAEAWGEVARSGKG
jgi:tetratricopeptide (TPR) repeat protein